MEALAVTSEKCIQERISRKQVYTAIREYLMKVLENYEIISGLRIK